MILERDLQELFTDLHEAKIVTDGKEISDAIILMEPSALLHLYRKEKEDSSFDIQRFYEQHFRKAEEISSGYTSDTSKSVVEHIEALWPVLTRVPEEPDYHSSRIPLPYPYIVPGGRFNEVYYWDSYFTMLGLKESGKHEMIIHMLDNFAWLIDQYGFVPNGNRTYYLGRSQPPFFSLMVDLGCDIYGDELLVKYKASLEAEYNFWTRGVQQLESETASGRTVLVDDNNFLNRYYDDIKSPRTEMYSDDIELIEKQPDKAIQTITDIRAACESGWDFTARWLRDPNDLATIHTTDILPVDLNCLLYFLEKTLAKACRLSDEKDQAAAYQSVAEKRAILINDTFWNSEKGFYFDYDHLTKSQTEVASLAGIFPMFFGLASEEQAAMCKSKVEQLFLCPGGLRSTTLKTGQQWDAPNGWAPLQWMAYKGLKKYGHDHLANDIKSRWLSLCEKVYKSTGKMREKYNVEDIQLESGGGEYPVQDGFGWTNGVYLAMYNDKSK